MRSHDNSEALAEAQAILLDKVMTTPPPLPGRVQWAAAVLRVHMRRHRFNLSPEANYDAHAVLADYARFLGIDTQGGNDVT